MSNFLLKEASITLPKEMYEPVKNAVLSIFGHYILYKMNISEYSISHILNRIKLHRAEEKKLDKTIKSAYAFLKKRTPDSTLTLDLPKIFVDDSDANYKDKWTLRVYGTKNLTIESESKNERKLNVRSDDVEKIKLVIDQYRDEFNKIFKKIYDEYVTTYVESKTIYEYATKLTKLYHFNPPEKMPINMEMNSYIPTIVNGTEIRIRLITIIGGNGEFSGQYQVPNIISVVFYEKIPTHSLSEIQDLANRISETVYHEVGHLYQHSQYINWDYVTPIKYTGLPKTNILNRSVDVFGKSEKGTREHYLRDIEFKTNLHSWAHEITNIFHRIDKNDRKDVFNFLTSNMDEKKRAQLLRGFYLNYSSYIIKLIEYARPTISMQRMKTQDYPRWKQMVKELYREVFF